MCLLQAHAFFRFMKIAQSRPREQASCFAAVDRNEGGLSLLPVDSFFRIQEEMSKTCGEICG